MNTRAFWYALPSLAISIAIVAAFALYAHEHRAPASPTHTLGSAATVVTVVSTSTNQREETRTTSTSATTTATAPTKPTHTTTISLSIQNLYVKKSIAITEGETMLALLMQQNTTDPKMRLVTQEYSGLGALVTSMGGQTNGTDKQYWQYRVNGVEPQVGASGYILKNGDAVEWVFAPSAQ